ncbi:juvenile hormone esterase-like isoform X1 [Hylaeus anthracinus]|uniref:juvenile hormone esterase-like isoform X1 n=1 Tax=Hylaeus anthracinus TaxID=313031 RepID=UPI0023B91CAD|nr:juvenile hormone esterase-like isoform X1 [Hylaeus anthracinus]
MNVLASLSFLMLTAVGQCLEREQTAIINTTLGPVQGSIKQTVWNNVKYSSFKGIRYAAPPVGNLRFQPPRPPQPWTKVLNATKEGSVCPQIDGFSTEYMGDEDCLHLSVFTPETNFDTGMTLRPVMIWIFGGSYTTGYVNTTLYGPDFLMEQDVVVVSVNYRLGALGFLYLNNTKVLGNAAMKDQVLGMRWVQDNIAAFGGDKTKVTVAGQSAGCAAVLLHHLSDKSKDLFTRSICHSGTPLVLLFSTPVSALKSAHRLAAALGVDNKDTNQIYRELVNIPAMKLVLATSSFKGLSLSDLLPFRPTIENPANASPQNTFLSECPITLVMTGKFKKCEKIFGYMANEALEFTDKLFSMANQTMVFRELNYKLIGKTAQFLTTVVAIPAVDYTQRLLEANNDGYPIYYYVNSYTSNYSIHRAFGIPIEGAAHMDDVGFLWNADAMNAPTDPNAPLNQFRRKYVTLWANFVKYGNPTPITNNPIGGVVWQPSGRRGVQLEINDKFRMVPRSIPLASLAIETFLYAAKPVASCCHNISYDVPYTSIFP